MILRALQRSWITKGAKETGSSIGGPRDDFHPKSSMIRPSLIECPTPLTPPRRRGGNKTRTRRARGKINAMNLRRNTNLEKLALASKYICSMILFTCSDAWRDRIVNQCFQKSFHIFKMFSMSGDFLRGIGKIRNSEKGIPKKRKYKSDIPFF